MTAAATNLDRIAKLEIKLSGALGRDVEVTIRTETLYTISTTTPDPELEAAVLSFFAGNVRLERATEHDDECGTFVYVEFTI